jgi:hypothetical protein
MAVYGKRQSLEEWIDEAFSDGIIEGVKTGVITHIILMHMVGTQERELHAIHFTGAKQWTPKELAELFDAKARYYSQDLPGTQTFCLLAFYDGEVNPQARHPFTITSSEPDFNGLTTESPDAKGITQQGMRHLEVQQQEANRMVRHSTDVLTDLLKTVSAENKDLRSELHLSDKALREMVLGRLTEQHKFEMELKKEERNNILVEKITELAPLFANMLTGKEIFPVAKTDSILIDNIVKNLTPESLEALTKVLPPEIIGVFMTRMQEVQKLRAAAEEAAAKALTEGMSGEDDAAGGKE